LTDPFAPAAAGPRVVVGAFGCEEGPVNSSSEVAAYFAQLSRDLMTRPEGGLSFQRIAERAVEIVPAVDFASITLRRRHQRQPESVGSTSAAADRCDALQYELDEGPCLDAVSEDEAYLIHDVAHDQRWPRWGPPAAEAGAGSILSVRLANDQETLGALNLYAHRPHAFDPDSVDLALVFASHAATAINNANLVTGLQTALQSRHLIGVAQGILMSHYDMGLETAFEVLRRYSSLANVKLRVVARLVVEQRALPEDYSEFASLEANPWLGVAEASPEPATDQDAVRLDGASS
jgi:GAF domain-containing protein